MTQEGSEVQIEYFAAARELAGCAHERVPLPHVTITLAELRALLCARHPRLTPYLPRMRLAINDELHTDRDIVTAGDEIAVLPPVAGGSDACSYTLLEEPLSVDKTIAAVQHRGAGGIVLFIGVVRDHAEQGAVARLDYEAHHRLALAELSRILTDVVQEHPGTRLSVQHRVGTLLVGDIAVIVAASAAHRAEAFSACRKAIDRIKETVPIWKKEWAPDGTALWVNL
ncbi:MAG: hypothetical protein RL701_308 [Pseudomonadota bacterium]